MESVCSRRAGPLQQSSGVRGAICQWKTISGERSVPLVLMSTAGSFCSQRRHAKAIKGREQSSAESRSHRNGGTHALHAHLYSFSLLFDASGVLDTHSYTHAHTQRVMPSHTDKWTNPVTSPLTHHFQISLKRFVSLHITAGIGKVLIGK